MYTASFAFFEALWEFGVRNCFVNLGSDHPSIIEAIVKGQKEKPDEFPKIYTCPNEMLALSLADAYARLTSQPQCVIIHVDVGTQGLGAAVHNASTGRAPVLIFAGLSPYTCDGELRGTRTEYIHWIQDVPDQRAIVAQYCRYTAEIKTGRNVKQMVGRALQFAISEKGPVYLVGAREVMEEELEPYNLDPHGWGAVGPAGLPVDGVEVLVKALVGAERPLVVCGYSGRDHKAVGELVRLTELVKGLRVLETGGSDLCFPHTHRASLGLRYSVHPSIEEADVILVLCCDVPWIPVHNKPKKETRIFHVDSDVLKRMMPIFWIEAEGRWTADAGTALRQICGFIEGSEELKGKLKGEVFKERWERLRREQEERMSEIKIAAEVPTDGSINASSLTAAIRKMVPQDTIFAVEAVTNTALITDQLSPEIPGSYINCGGGGLGWSGGGALGIKLATEALEGKGKGKFVCQIVGDGTFLFSVPGSVYWMAARYNIPVLTIILNNVGWNAPRKSLLLVHPNGQGSKVSNEELNISFNPTPDYAGIAYAAAGHKAWAGTAGSTSDLEQMLPQAIEAVKGGRVAVLDIHLGGGEGKFNGTVGVEGIKAGIDIGKGKIDVGREEIHGSQNGVKNGVHVKVGEVGERELDVVDGREVKTGLGGDEVRKGENGETEEGKATDGAEPLKAEASSG